MKALGEAAEISAAYICRLEKGERQPSRELIERLVQVLCSQSTPQERDELMMLAGFAPRNYRAFAGRDDILARYEGLLQETPDDFKSYIALVMLLIRSGRLEEAETLIESGLSRFDDQIQLQALLAALELARHNYETAIQYQQSAINYFHISPKTHHLSLPDLLLSLGVMYFSQGELWLDRKNEYDCQGLSAQSLTAGEKARSSLLTARETYAQALTITPEDIYLRDEYARVCFSLACLPGTEQPELWQACIDSFQRVICSANKHELGQYHLFQSTAFLGHALTRSGQLEAAWHHLNIVEACAPHAALIHYLKACYFCQKFTRTPVSDRQTCLQQSLNALRQALQGPHGDPTLAQEALRDPDLEALRTFHKSAFYALIETVRET